jgi:hypothetical protein
LTLATEPFRMIELISELKKNADGSVDIYFGPTALAGQ